jgi:predicted nucleic acid-binding protein
VVEQPAVDASPIILLTKIERLTLLQLAGTSLVVPRAVMREVAQRGVDDLAFRAIRETSWLSVVDTPAAPDAIQQWNLQAGETAVLTWAWAHPGAQVILDDRTARRCAAALGITVRGTLGLILTAKARGTIPLARPLIEQLCEAGYYLSDRTMNDTLALVGE